METVTFIPSILVSIGDELEQRLARVEGIVDRIHLDIADGIFVPNTTIEGYRELENLDTTVAIEAHLMVSKPENHITSWLESQCDRIIFHVESTSQPRSVISMIKDGEKEVGIALNPSTALEEIEGFIDVLDFVHFMTVEPGFYGADFVEDVVEKIKDFHFLYPDIPIGVDGAVTPATAGKLAQVGATRMVVGSYVFDNEDVTKALGDLKQSIS